MLVVVFCFLFTLGKFILGSSVILTQMLLLTVIGMSSQRKTSNHMIILEKSIYLDH